MTLPLAERLITARASEAAIASPAETRWLESFEATLGHFLPVWADGRQRLGEAMRYAVLGGGKRLRPRLVQAAAQAATTAGGAALAGPMISESLQRAAAAVELVHAYSLIHDDLPAMDDDVMRRHRPTLHIAFDEAIAILAGDTLQCLAFELVADGPLDPAAAIAMVRALAAGSGGDGMAGGQAIDLGAMGKPLDLADLEAMHQRKTGALIRSAMAMGGIAVNASAETMASLDRFGAALGLAFQIRDDQLDVDGDPDVLGKSAGKDAAQAKPTFATVPPAMIEARLAELRADADDARAALPGDTAGLARLFVESVDREH